MIAVAKIGGHQAIVKVGDKLEVDKLSAEVGKKVTFDTLLLSEEDGKNFQVGTPFLNGVQVEAKIIEHARGEKVRVFKMKPRKRYRRLRGHRQDYTVIEILSVGSVSAKAEAKPVVKKVEKKGTEKKTVSAKKSVVSAAVKTTVSKKKSTVSVSAKAMVDKKKVAKSAEKK